MFKSLAETSVDWEVVFACTWLDLVMKNDPDAEFIKQNYFDKEYFQLFDVRDIKPAQCYEIARRQCKGETVVWMADDCEFPNNVIGKAYAYWKSKDDRKLILSIQTKESGYGCKDGRLYPMKEHTFFSLMPETPLMAPIAMMSREYLEELGGLDRRYVCGQYENDIVMRAYADGAKVEVFGGEDCFVDIDHLGKSIMLGESTDEETFKQRPFATGYSKDRQILEESWTTFDQSKAFRRLEAGERPFTLREMSKVQLDKFEPYAKQISLTESESNKGKWQ